MGRKRLIAVLVVVLVIAAVTPGAAAQVPSVPKDAPVVAGPTPSGARLVAFDDKRRLCLALLSRHERRAFAYPQCERPRHSLREVNLDSGATNRVAQHWGVVEPEVASVDLVLRRGRSVHVPTSEGAAYKGQYAGKVRFLVAEVRGGFRFMSARYLRLYDAAGTLLGLGDAYGAESRVGRSRELARGTTSGAPWSFEALRMRQLASLPGQEERFVELSCVEVRRRGSLRAPTRDFYDARSRARTCVNPEVRRSVAELQLDQECSRLGLVATGIVTPEVQAVVAVLGDGSRRPLLLRRVPGGGHAFALVVGRRVALRRLVGVTRGGGRRLLRDSAGPGVLRCGDSGALVFSYDLRPFLPSGPIALRVYDDGVELCATLGLPTRHPDECSYPPIAPEDAWILTRTEGERKLLAGIVPGDVKTAVVELHGGERITVATGPASGYAGRYAGSLRFFTLELAADATVWRIRVVDTHGRRATVRYGERPPPAGPRRLVVGGLRGLRLWVELYELSGTGFSPYLCVRLGRSECSFAAAFGPALRVDCSPRRVVLWGLLPRGASGIAVETDRGRFAGRVRALPRGLRPRRPARQRSLRRIEPVSAYVLTVPGRAKPKALLVTGRRNSRERLRLPSAAAQCGYEDFLS
jgi:hypothetical protein